MKNRIIPEKTTLKRYRAKARACSRVLLSLFLIFSLFLPLSAAAEKTGSASGSKTGSTSADGSISGLSPEEILKKMTLEQKIAQMLLPSVRDEDKGGQDLTTLTATAEKAIREHCFCGYLFFDPNCGSIEQMTGLTASMQRAACGSESKLQIPLLLTVDQEGGRVSRIGAGTLTPGNTALGASWNSRCAEETAEIIGSELASLGFNLDYAPVMDLSTDPASSVIALRSFGGDPAAAGIMGASFISGLHQADVAACMKHFPGHGATSTDSHTDLPVIEKSLKELKKSDLIPFQEGIGRGADMIMTAHIQYPAIEKDTYTSISTGKEVTLPATLSDDILTDLLRGDMGYDGVIISDALKMGAIAKHFDLVDATELAVNAGVDIIMNPGDITTEAHVKDLETYISQIAGRVKEGRIREKTIDQAVLRILEMKEKRGLLEDADSWRKMKDSDAAALVTEAVKNTGSEEHKESIRSITESTTTLLKNDGSALPVKTGSTVILCPEQGLYSSVSSTVDQLKTDGVIDGNSQVSVVNYGGLDAAYAGWNVSQYENVIAISAAQSADAIGRSAKDAFLRAALKSAHQNGSRFTLISAFLPYDAAAWQDADAILLTYGCRSATEIPRDQAGEIPDYGPGLPAAVRAAFGAFIPSGHLPLDLPKMDSSQALTEELLYQTGFGLRNWSEKETVSQVRTSDYSKEESLTDGEGGDPGKEEAAGSRKERGGAVSLPVKCAVALILAVRYLLI